jgi:pyridinium-3,5-biscarboxylic acid mononucleotide synthase
MVGASTKTRYMICWGARPLPSQVASGPLIENPGARRLSLEPRAQPAVRVRPRRRVRRSRHQELRVAGVGRLDIDRPRRTGVPEVILGEGKTTDHLVAILRALHRQHRGGLVSRPSRAQIARLRAEAGRGLPLRFFARDRVVQLAGNLRIPRPRGSAAILTAGTADVLIAEEAASLLEVMGVRVLRAYDVGVAGLHRLQRALVSTERFAPTVYLVFAGREGALPTVVSGLVRAPVVGIPTSVGYGWGGRGSAALAAMLQSCAPIAVVNIDGSIPAALFALHLLQTASRRRAPR